MLPATDSLYIIIDQVHIQKEAFMGITGIAPALMQVYGRDVYLDTCKRQSVHIVSQHAAGGR